MRPSYVLPAAMGRMARIGYSPRHEEPLTPLGGDFHYFPERTGINGWTFPYTTTTGNVFIRMVFVSPTAPNISVTYGGVTVPLLTSWQTGGNRPLSVAIFGGKGFPIGAGDVIVSNSTGDAGLCILKVGSLRDYSSLGAVSSYSSEGTASGLGVSSGTTPGNDLAFVCGVTNSVNVNLRPVEVRPYYPTSDNPPVIYPSSYEITELISTDGLTKVVGVFGASTTQTLPYPASYQGTQLVFRWNQNDRLNKYASSSVEVIGSVP